MGKIQGDVRVVGISNILLALSLNKCQGYLTISEGAQKKVIQFGSPGIRMVSGARRTNPLGEILLRSGKLTLADLQGFLAEQRRTGQPLGRIIVDRGVVPQGELDNALREQVAEEIYDLFTWRDATFEFCPPGGDLPPPDDGPLASVTLDASIMSITMEAARRLDELGRIRALIPDDEWLAERTPLAVPADDPGLDRAVVEKVLPLADGRHSVAQIVKDSYFPAFAVLRTLYGLAQRGAIRFRKREGSGILALPPVAAPLPVAAAPGKIVALICALPQFRAALALAIRRAGYEVVEGGGVADAIQMARARKPDALVLDVSLETEEGLTFLPRQKETAAIPVIVLADNSSTQAVGKAIRAGARHVLIKPVREPVLLERIAGLVKK